MYKKRCLESSETLSYTEDARCLRVKHLSQHDTKACILAQQESVSSVCSWEVTACFRSTYIANCFPASSLLWSPEMDVTGPILSTRCITGYHTTAGGLFTTIAAVQMLFPVTCIQRYHTVQAISLPLLHGCRTYVIPMSNVSETLLNGAWIKLWPKCVCYSKGLLFLIGKCRAQLDTSGLMNGSTKASMFAVYLYYVYYPSK